MSEAYPLTITYQDNLPFDTGSHFNKTVEARVIQKLSQEMVFTIDAKYHPQATNDAGKRSFLADPQANREQTGAYTQAMLDAYLLASEPYIEMPTARQDATGQLHLIAPDGVTLYSIDITPILQKSRIVDVAATSIRRKGGVIGLSITTNGAPHLARSLQTHELRVPGEVACGHTYRFSGLGSEVHACARGADHVGDHLQLREARGGYARWGQDGGGMATWDDLYGIQAACAECGFPTLELASHLCDTDMYWRQQATEDLRTAFVIDGKHYRPGRGGFGGLIFDIERHDGTLWSGELFGQGNVPERWRDRIPDNAKILRERRPVVRQRY